MTAPLNDTYRAFLDRLSDGGSYRTFTVHEFYVLRGGTPDPEKVNVVLRADIDEGLHLTVPFAEELKERGLKASFYFLTDPDRHYRIWGSGIPGEVRKLGHEVGLHTDHYYEQGAYGTDGIRELKSDIRKLSEEAGEEIKGMVYHGHPDIDRTGALNWDLYRDLPPEELGLAYHDGPASCYTTPGYNVWVPRCDCNLSDFLGVPGPGGWTYFPSWPVKALERLEPGSVCHIGVHPKNAFRYWIDWDSRYGEHPARREGGLSSLLKKCRIRYYLVFLPAFARFCRRLFSASVRLLSYIVMYGGAVFVRKAEQKEPDTSRETEVRIVFDEGIEYWHGKLREMGLLKKGISVLEVGCGYGQWLMAFAREAREVAGIEPHPEIRVRAIEKIRELGLEDRISVVDASAEHIPFPDGRFDVVLCLGVFQFTRQYQALGEMHRVLKPGGSLALAVNGIGYFLMNVANGIRFKRLDLTYYGLSGCIATVLKWLTRRDLGFTTAVSVSEMRRSFAGAGFRMKDVRPWVDMDRLPLRHTGCVVNYLFIAEKL